MCGSRYGRCNEWLNLRIIAQLASRGNRQRLLRRRIFPALDRGSALLYISLLSENRNLIRKKMATTVFGMDTPMERPSAGERAGVFVPSMDASETVKAAMKNGSGMCGFGNLDGSVMIYFENNKFNDSS